MNASLKNNAAYTAEFQAKYARRAASIADAIAHFSGDTDRPERSEDAEIIAGAALFLSSYLDMIAVEAEKNAAFFRGEKA
ncbi:MULTISPECIES: hypothetical protein [Acetobacter]|uniref:Uncharacterized protein n=1 Tax=Acetobacter pasteurianus NBRC 3188 TaxID=1226663 RepID=A0A401WRU0_ACEPA|nr:hypothetical protein [Acetobacter pasteurianus]KDE21227.1 hypothetical protein AZ09_03790 [Acetobacter aceti 1023]GCD52033.1 hypothetical protein NBRC3188_0730 [Acetobacter pasteurianus NBRC 3188]